MGRRRRGKQRRGVSQEKGLLGKRQKKTGALSVHIIQSGLLRLHSICTVNMLPKAKNEAFSSVAYRYLLWRMVFTNSG